MIDLEPIKARAAAALPWPAQTVTNGAGVQKLDTSRWSRDEWNDAQPGNIEFMAHARTDIPALIAEVEELRSLLAGSRRLGLHAVFLADAIGDADMRAEKAAYDEALTGPLRAEVERQRAERGLDAVDSYIDENAAGWLYDHAEGPFTDYLNQLCLPMGESWDDDIAQSALVQNFINHYGALDRLIEDESDEDADVVIASFDRTTRTWSIASSTGSDQ